VEAEFVFKRAPVAAAHASTLAETSDGLIAAWFGGPFEGHSDVGIWVARRSWHGGRWSDPCLVADGVQPDGNRFACWNPVLYLPASGPLLLFYKVGPNPSRWWGMVTTSADSGHIWSPPRRLPDGILGPIKNKPVETPQGLLLCPSSSEHAGWRVHLECSPDLGQSWTTIGPLNTGRDFAAIQPCILSYPQGGYQMLCRTRQRVVTECWSHDGVRWSAMRPTALPNPDSGIDGLVLKDGRGVVVYNHSKRGRTPLNVAVSNDGKSWGPMVVLEREPGEYSYPAVIQGSDGRVHITYTWNRQTIKYAAVDPRELCRLA
jgi:predicted neuraminidase